MFVMISSCFSLFVSELIHKSQFLQSRMQFTDSSRYYNQQMVSPDGNIKAWVDLFRIFRMRGKQQAQLSLVEHCTAVHSGTCICMQRYEIKSWTTKLSYLQGNAFRFS